MGQKSNINTLRPLNQTTITGSTIKLNFLELTIIKSLKLLLKIKKIETSQIVISNLNNKIFVNFYTFFGTQRIIRFKKLKHIYCNSKKLHIKNIFKKILKLLRVSVLEIKITNLNKIIDKSLVRKIFLLYRKYINNLFDKKFYLCVDITKITVLFLLNKVDNDVFLNYIAKIFSTIHKKNHLRFFKLVSTIFTFLIANPQKNNKILGLKLLVSGKLRGKTMASKQLINYGSMPVQTLNKNIYFEKLHVYTIYGVFGFKLWTHKNMT